MSKVKNLQKLFALLLVLTFVAGAVGFSMPDTAYAKSTDPLRNLDVDVDKLISDIEDENVKEAVLRLNAFGIIDGMEDGKYHPETKLTREQFAKILVTALKMDQAAGAGVGYKSFPDVESNRWSAGFIGVAAGQGLIKGYPDGTFKPTKEVSYAEAVTMLVRALGYKDEFLPGTWPGNYLAKGAEKDITKKVRFNDAAGVVDRGDAAILVNNTLDAKVVVVKTYKGEATEYEEKEWTLLEDKFNIVKCEDARITATKRIDDGLKWEQVNVYFTKEIKDAKKDTVKFKEETDKNFDLIKGFNPELILGEEATVYINDDDVVVYAESENDDKVNFDYIEEVTNKDELTLVKFDDDYPFADDAYVYMKDGDKVKQVNVDKFDDYDFVGKVGKFVVSNNEIVWAELMESTEADPWFVVMENNKGLLTGICADNAEHDVDLREDEDYDGVIVLDIDGQEISVDDIEEGNLIYVQKQELDGDDYAIVRVVKDNIIEGKLEKVEEKKIHLNGKGIKVVNNDNGIFAYYSVNDGDEINQYNFKNADVRDDMEDADDEDIVAYTDAVGRIAYFVTKASATSGYKYGVVTKVYKDGDRIKVYVVDNDGEGDEITYTMEEDNNLKEDGAFALNEYGQKFNDYSDKQNRATVKEGSPIKFKLNKDGEIAEDKIYVHDVKNVWTLHSRLNDKANDFGKDYLPVAKLYSEYKYDSSKSANIGIEDNKVRAEATFAADDNTRIIDAETYKLTTATQDNDRAKLENWFVDYNSSDFDPAKWKDLKESNGIDGYFYVFADDDNKYDAKAVVFIGYGSGAASDDEIGIYVIKEWYKSGDRYVKYHEYDGEIVEKELDDDEQLYAGKEYPYVAKVKSNGKLEILKPKFDDFTVFFGEIESKDASRMEMNKVFKVTEIGNTKDHGKNAFKEYEESNQRIFNISNKTLVYEEDNKKTTSSLKKGDLVIFIAEKGSNVRVIEKLKSGKSDYNDIADKVGKPTPGKPPVVESGVVTYINKEVKLGTDEVLKITLPADNTEVYTVVVLGEDGTPASTSGKKTLVTKTFTATDLIPAPGTVNAVYAVKVLDAKGNVVKDSESIVRNIDKDAPTVTSATLTDYAPAEVKQADAGNIVVKNKKAAAVDFEIVAPTSGAVDQPLKVTVDTSGTNPLVKVELATDASGNLATTWAQIVNAVNGNNDAKELVELSLKDAAKADEVAAAATANVDANTAATPASIKVVFTQGMDTSITATKVTIDGVVYNGTVVWDSSDANNKTADIELDAEIKLTGKKLEAINLVKANGTPVVIATPVDLN